MTTYVDKRSSAILRQLRKAGHPLHRRELRESAGIYQDVVRDLVQARAIRYLGCGYYTLSSLPPVQESAMVEALSQARYPMDLGELAALGVDQDELDGMVRRGVLTRMYGGHRYGLPKQTVTSKILAALADGPRTWQELLDIEGVHPHTIYTLIYRGRIKMVSRGLYALPGCGAPIQTQTVTSRIMDAVADGPRTRQELVSLLGIRSQNLDTAVRRGHIQRIGRAMYARAEHARGVRHWSAGRTRDARAA